jgi:hypothetical protein
VGEVGLETWALERRVWPLEAGCDSFPWLLPMVSVKAAPKRLIAVRCRPCALGYGGYRGALASGWW